MDEIIQVRNLSKLYKLYQNPFDRVKETFSRSGKSYCQNFYALNDVSFSIERGATIGIIGKNGSGKSTLLKILTGVLKPTLGEVLIHGKVSALLELGAGFNMEFTGRQNIFLNGTIMRIPKDEMEKRVPEILKFADIGDFIDQPVKTYSSGMFVRLAFAVAINVDPEILIVDEALAVGDTRFQLKCMDKFKEFQKKGKTILFVSHDINSIKRFCERTIWINDGKLIMDGDTNYVTDQYTDFLKSEMPMEDYLKTVQSQAIPEKEIYTQEELDQVDIAEVLNFEIYNQRGIPVEQIHCGDPLKVKVTYAVNDLSIKNPVLGVAIRSMDEDYICGLNTLLDDVRIPWRQGLNEVELTYSAFSLAGGHYYFDVAIMDSTASVNIDYKAKIKTIFVDMEYVGEGLVVLDHSWKL